MDLINLIFKTKSNYNYNIQKFIMILAKNSLLQKKVLNILRGYYELKINA